jgi:solute:Na+ symporter, SSS family
MSNIDWWVLCATLLTIVSYGLFKSKTSKNLEGYFLSNRSMPWYLVLLGIMGTQASAITFLSAPGQAFTDGMRFVQYYFGLPLAMVVLCITFVPLFNKLQVFTAYEYLEQRFNTSTRLLTSALFLISRGLSTGISIYAPSIILSSLLGWDIFYTNIVMGGVLIVYTVSGGAKAVAYTQQIQLVIIFLGLIATGYYIVHLMPANIGFKEALNIGGAGNKLNIITTGITNEGFNIKDKYNIISGTIGGFFLALSYFGTDQSQVGRYLTAKNTTESKLGLLINGLVKVPMQFLILLLGVLLFSFYQFAPKPIFFNKSVQAKAINTQYKIPLENLEKQYTVLQKKQQFYSASLQTNNNYKDSIRLILREQNTIQANYKQLLKKAIPTADTNDTNYIFLRFVIDYLPKGLVGLLIAIIFLAAWGSIAAALNSLASCTMIDFHKKLVGNKNNALPEAEREKKEYIASKWYTFAWGIFCIITAQLSSGLGSLIEAVNVLGSLFYGVILGIFLVAFYLPSIKGKAVFIAAIIGEILVIILFKLDSLNIIGIGFLWLNVIGALLVCSIAFLVQKIGFKKV